MPIYRYIYIYSYVYIKLWMESFKLASSRDSFPF